MPSSRRLTAVTIGSLALSLGLWGVGYLPAATAAATTATYYFHGASDPNDDANRVNGTPSATFDQTAPTGSSDSTQTGTGNANPDSAANPLAVYWVGDFTGHISGTMHFDWFWSTANAETALIGESATVTIFGDGVEIGSGDVDLTIGTSPTLNHSDVTGVDGDVANELLVQVAVDNADTGRGVTAHYNSTTSPSSFQVPVDNSGGGGGGGGGTGGGPVTGPTGPQKFANFASPQPNPHEVAQPPTGVSFLKGEPSLGVDWVTNNTMYQGDLNTWQIHFDYADGQLPAADWRDRSNVWTDEQTLDARLIVDHTGAQRGTDDRTVVDQLFGVQSAQAYTDDDGGTTAPPANTGDWVPSSAGGVPVGPDHESLGAGPYAAPAPSTANATGYPHAVYYCGQAELLSPQPGPTAFCSRSDTGGATWNKGVGVFTQSQCSGLHGKPRVGPDGTVYLPNKDCSAAGGANAVKGLLVSTDNGETWALRNIPNTSTDDNQPDPDVAVGGTSGAGVVYYAYRDGDHHAKVVTSTDRGQTWSTPTDLGVPFDIQNAQFPEVIAGDANRAAVSFLGTRVPTTSTKGQGDKGDDLSDNFTDPTTGKPAVWDLYIAFTYDAGQTWQIVDATPNLPVQRGGICMNGTGCTGSDRNMLDFNDMNIDRDGRVQVAYTDGCFDDCETNPSGGTGKFSSVFSLVDQTCGQGLFAAKDPGFNNDPTCAPGATLAEFPIQIAPVFFGFAVIGGFAILRRRRRNAKAA